MAHLKILGVITHHFVMVQGVNVFVNGVSGELNLG